MGFDDRELKAVIRVMENGVLSGYMGNVSGMYGGPEIQALEKEWSEYFGVKHAIALNSNTSGLWCALATLDLQKDDEVIVTPYSMTCSASLPLLFGAKPVFADIEPDYFCLDPKSVEDKITSKTRAIVVVDLFGQPYNADAINAIAKKHNLVVIEDAAQAPGAKYKGKFAGTLGDIGVYSLNYHKHIHCGEGGIVVTDNDEYAMKIRLFANHAEAIVNDHERIDNPLVNMDSLIGMNLRMTELQACIARVQLTKLDDILKVYRRDAESFPIKVREGCEHSFYRYAWLKHMPDDISGYAGFKFKKHYILPIYKMPLFRELGYPQDLCLVCEQVNEEIVLAWHEVAP